MPVVLGSDILIDRQLLRGRTIGLVANPASVDARLRHVAERAEAGGVRIGALFGPQHGFTSDLQENMIESPHATDSRRRVPVYSLYSETREPTAKMLAGLDALVIDLQDVGTRIYTYIYTMANCLRAARTHGMPVIVCDRPNPIGGVAVEGPALDPAFASFVGQFPIPMRHGMTIGELAKFFNEHFGLGAKLEVVTMQGWSRDQYFDQTGLTWIPPSPNVPTLDSAIVYPGTVLLEGTNVSEGRGTTRPFEFVGAPWVDPDAFASGLNGAGPLRRVLPPDRVRADVPQTRRHARAAAARFTCSIARRSSPWRSASRSSTRFGAPGPIGSPGATRRTSTNTRSRRSTSCTDRPRCEKGWPRAGRQPIWRREMRQDAAAFLDERRRWLLY